MAAGFKTATVNASDVAATLTDYPTYVDLSRLGITTLAEAQSVRVYADSGKTTEWAREIVSVTEMHVKIPSLTTTTDIYVDWDGVRSDYAVTATYGRNAVWTEYEAVWHFEGAVGTSEKIQDSTGNGNTAGENNSPTSTAGKLGGANGGYDLTGLAGSTSSTTLYDWITLGTFYTKIGSNLATVSCWVNLDIQSTVGYSLMNEEQNTVFGRPNFGMSIDTSNQARFRYATTTSAATNASSPNSSSFSLNTWTHIVGRREAAATSITVDGTRSSTTQNTVGSFPVGNNSMFLNRRYNSNYSSAQRYIDGQFDEARLATKDLGTDWVTTEHNNQNDEASFWGTWTDAGGGSDSSIKSIDGVLKADIASFNGVTLL